MNIIGIILFTLGLSLFYRPVLEWFITINNNMRGTATKITGGTIITYRIFALLFIFIGVLVFLGIID